MAETQKPGSPDDIVIGPNGHATVTKTIVTEYNIGAWSGGTVLQSGYYEEKYMMSFPPLGEGYSFGALTVQLYVLDDPGANDDYDVFVSALDKANGQFTVMVQRTDTIHQPWGNNLQLMALFHCITP